jgi:molybdenum cofactor cytidylyltransferase
VAFGTKHLPQLLTLDGDQGARSLLTVHPITLIEVNDAGVLRDIDTPADLG